MFKKFFVVGILLSFLVACSSLSDTDVEITNLFSLDGQKLQSVKFTSGNGTSAATFTGTFADLPLGEFDTEVKLPELYQGIPPLRLAEKFGLQTVMEARSKAGRLEQFPETFIFSAARLVLTFRDADEDPVLTKDFTSQGDLTMTFTKEKCEVLNGNSIFCTYKTAYSEALLDLEFLSTDTRKIFNEIMTGGSKDETNFVSGNFSLTFAGDSFPPSDTEAVLTMQTSDGKIFF
jgi:hypothetical protein